MPNSNSNSVWTCDRNKQKPIMNLQAVMTERGNAHPPMIHSCAGRKPEVRKQQRR